jgi:hypothetical protein
MLSTTVKREIFKSFILNFYLMRDSNKICILEIWMIVFYFKKLILNDKIKKYIYITKNKRKF